MGIYNMPTIVLATGQTVANKVPKLLKLIFYWEETVNKKMKDDSSLCWK